GRQEQCVAALGERVDDLVRAPEAHGVVKPVDRTQDDVERDRLRVRADAERLADGPGVEVAPRGRADDLAVALDGLAVERGRQHGSVLSSPGPMRVKIVDAFTDRAFAGNPAAVCFLDGADWPDAGWMQRVAVELNMPMTAFALPQGGDWGLRWFTPLIEERL